MAMTQTDQSTLRRVLALDALTCTAAGAVMALGAQPLSGWTGLPAPLLLGAGAILFPIAALFGWMSQRRQLAPGLVWLAVLGNAGWVLASLAVLPLTGPTPFGYAFVLAQAAVVAVLASLEARGLREHQPAPI